LSLGETNVWILSRVTFMSELGKGWLQQKIFCRKVGKKLEYAPSRFDPSIIRFLWIWV
jgi:hypothetical protein